MNQRPVLGIARKLLNGQAWGRGGKANRLIEVRACRRARHGRHFASDLAHENPLAGASGMRSLLLLCSAGMVSLAAIPADACVCRWFGREKGAESLIAAAARSAEIIVHGTIIAESAVPAGASAWTTYCPGAAFWRTVRVDHTIAGELARATKVQPVLITVMISRPLQPGSASCDEMTTCDVRPDVGTEQIWALKRMKDGQLMFADTCITDAARRVYHSSETPVVDPKIGATNRN